MARSTKLTVTKLQRRFNKLIRSDGNETSCITCGRVEGKMDAGHFMATGSHPSVRFDTRNVHKQCSTCNQSGSGEGAYYYEWMLDAYGANVINELKREGRRPIKWSQTRLQRILDLIKEGEREVKEYGYLVDDIKVSDYAGEEWD